MAFGHSKQEVCAPDVYYNEEAQTSVSRAREDAKFGTDHVCTRIIKFSQLTLHSRVPLHIPKLLILLQTPWISNSTTNLHIDTTDNLLYHVLDLLAIDRIRNLLHLENEFWDVTTTQPLPDRVFYPLHKFRRKGGAFSRDNEQEYNLINILLSSAPDTQAIRDKTVQRRRLDDMLDLTTAKSDTAGIERRITPTKDLQTSCHGVLCC